MVKKQIITFMIINSILSSAIYFFMFYKPELRNVMVFLMMWTPGISAILTSLICRDKIRNYGWKLGKFRFLLYAFFIPIIVAFIAYGSLWITGITEIFAEGAMNYKWARILGFDLPVPLIVGLLSKMLLAFPLILFVALGEEIGWSGFLIPKLSRMYSVTLVSLIAGAYFAIWHFPAIIGDIYGYGTPLWISLPGFTLAALGATFFKTALIKKSKSLWTGAILHTSHNLFLMGIFHDLTLKEGYASYLVSETGVFLGIIYLIVALVFWKRIK